MIAATTTYKRKPLATSNGVKASKLAELFAATLTRIVENSNTILGRSIEFIAFPMYELFLTPLRLMFRGVAPIRRWNTFM